MSFALIGRMLARRAGIAPVQPDYPLRLAKAGSLERARVGGMLDLGVTTAFIIASGAGSIVQTPPTTATIDAHGKASDGEFDLHRFYFGDNLLQIVTGRDGLVVAGEVKLLQKLAEIDPATPAEWDLWLGGREGNVPFLTGPVIKWQDIEYNRVWSPGAGIAQPRSYVEALDVGQADPTLPTTTISAMLFARQLPGDITEWLQISVCRSNDGGRWIEAYVGLTLGPGEVSAI